MLVAGKLVEIAALDHSVDRGPTVSVVGGAHDATRNLPSASKRPALIAASNALEVASGK